jgi:drug/metabolite transporter (DMT)-like permease
MTAVLALLASLVWGTSDFMGGLASRRIRPLAVVAIAHLCALVPLVIIAASTHGFSAERGYLPWAAAAGAIGLVALVAFYSALSTGTMGIVAPIAGTGAIVPVIVGLASGESPSGLQIAGIVVAIGGVVLASGPEISGRHETGGTKPLVLALVAAAGFGAVFVMIDKASAHNVVMTLVAMRVVSVSIVMIAGAFYLLAVRPRRRSRRGRRLDPFAGVGWPQLPVIAVVGWTDAGANGLYGLATRHGLVSVVAVLASLYPAVTVILARVVEGERMRRVQEGGVALAMCGVLLLAVH